MSLVTFTRNFIGVKGHDAVENAIKAMVKLDPEAASLADLKTMEQDLDKVGGALARLRSELTDDRTAYNEAQSHYDQRLAAAELLGKQAEEATITKPGIETSLEKLLSEIERDRPDIERRKKDLTDLESLVSEAQETYDLKAKSLTEAKENLDRARHDLQRANLTEERARKHAEDAAAIAGLRPATSNGGLSVALDSMKGAAAEARQRADAAQMKTAALKSAHEPIEDPNIAEAMASVAGQQKPPQSLSERLAALRK